MHMAPNILDFGFDTRLIYGGMWLIAMVGMTVVVFFGFGE